MTFGTRVSSRYVTRFLIAAAILFWAAAFLGASDRKSSESLSPNISEKRSFQNGRM